MEEEIERIMEILYVNSYNEKLADQYIRDLLDHDKIYE